MKRFIFIFLDGVGLGVKSPHNPFFDTLSEFLPYSTRNAFLPDGTPVKPIDPLLGVKGLPQSGTGQTTLYTGQNIPRILNGHQGSYPNKSMRKILKKSNLLLNLKKRGVRVCFLNAYPVFTKYFSLDHINIHEDGRLHFSKEFPDMFKRRISVTSCMMITSELIPFDENDIINENSIFQDYSNRMLIERGLKLPEFSPEKAAEIIYKRSREFDFMLYEYFQTDFYGHRKSFPECVELIQNLNRLFRRLFSFLDKKHDTLLITSDHGNLEDCSIRAHTRNPVPLTVWGQGSEQIRSSINDITGVTPAILNFFTQ